MVKLQPKMLSTGTHHYLQLAEEKAALDAVDPAKLECIKIIFPTGAAVPPSCEVQLKQRFKGLVVRLQ